MEVFTAFENWQANPSERTRTELLEAMRQFNTEFDYLGGEREGYEDELGNYWVHPELRSLMVALSGKPAPNPVTEKDTIDRLYMTLGGLEADIREGNSNGDFVDGVRHCVSHLRAVLGNGQDE